MADKQCSCYPEPGHLNKIGCPIHDITKTRMFETGATRDSDNGKLDYEGFIAPAVWQSFAEYMHRCRLRNIPLGQEVRSSDNWQKGIPQDQYMKSLVRHVMEAWIQWREGTVTIDVFNAILFNVQGMILEELKIQRLNAPPVIED